jgi:hypothetical protein
MRRRTLYFLLSTLYFLSPALACPNCKDSVATTDLDTATQVGAAFNYSIFAMLAAVFATAAFVGRTLYKASQPARRPQ